MEIKYLGHSSFLIKSKDARIVTDPFDPKMVGLKFPKVEADIITVSHDHKDHNQVHGVEGTPTIFDWPGQFEKKGIRIWGFKTFHDKKQGAERGDNVMYKFEAEGISVLHCGDLGVVPDDAYLDEIGDVDVLLVPVGGFYTIDAEEAIDLIKKVEPAIVVPMHYGSDEIAIKELAPLSQFLKKIGIEQVIPSEKLVVKKDELEEEMKVIVLKA
ncbi:hypothetical protein A2334_00475 [Candidatus Roizmanbacteria bacterium RIFOXYB2_FULL_38_10]|uniref:Lactamase n=1 Tax=Candidatus Roizmanbacteria bacterium RIFOXYD1_FULL_38_12 TaxID=1802093 RepID=A0A1F7L1D8_9BACT|nr:MAG: hypothetical protein A3K47_03745 [Candidatus Roizmanbacteria bacterium RIFOXYA2_FULL_38_14]OGK63871.1 MAG: hypothetical protein A3K27_03745 [Candidatus Roizmanbacteria bacterium RIFOXYA1_FULL_37_12]OGK65717.1 MAG: hypothetical protein A3K38_03745 [Candidatus Roizmanbacteria bacterium RIFOXYB1_FULL_40_23]OGK68162.1 MAG: hypothetical protein A2334_00475 [Candidatus Roizmanbacteria bacterium RIFOXYB2_FULL_38_10]OGK70122.1 MAG: hypothetical protein A3K21_03750 [Candidatus Roizmanbacteria ba